MFAGLLELREQEYAGHGRAVADLTMVLADALSMSEADRQQLYYAALLHDIGKIALPDPVIQTPYELLSDADRTVYIEHPVISERALLALDSFPGAARVARHHHENFDGSGYPDGLAGEQIPLGSRIIAIASDFDALQRGMLVDEQYTEPEARAYLKRHAGHRYDPNLVKTMLAVVKPGMSGPGDLKEQRLMSHELRPGMVLSRDLQHFDGMLLLRSGKELNDHLIARIRDFEGHARKRYSIFVGSESPGGD